MNLEGDLHAYPARLGVAQAPEPDEVQDYLEVSTEGLAARCAEEVAGWDADAPEKVAAPIDPHALYKDPQAHPLALTLLTLDRYGQPGLEWDPEVLRATMMRDGLQVSGSAWTKLLASRVLLSSPSPWRQWEVFHWCSRALAGQPPNFTYCELPELGHLAVAADVMKIVDPKRPIGSDPQRFTAATLQHEGYCWAPKPLDFAQRALEQPQLHCRHCDALFPDDHDVKCISCGRAALEAVPYFFSGLRDHCSQLWQPRVKLPLERAVDGLPENGPGNLVYGWATQWDYVQRQRRALSQQLRGISR